MRRPLTLIAILTAIALPGLLTLRAQDAAKPEPVRTVLERHDQSGFPGKEIVIGTATLPKGSTIPYHTHPGDEAGYVVRGTLILKARGQPDRILNAGDSFFNPRGAVHSLAAVSSDGVAASAWIIDKGAPLATPVP
ncbi:MAG: cupin domain-containing protein [Steroidobacteraceae bacterium]|jgi:quercetin dioxygenase-like cupin family protein